MTARAGLRGPAPCDGHRARAWLLGLSYGSRSPGSRACLPVRTTHRRPSSWRREAARTMPPIIPDSVRTDAPIRKLAVAREPRGLSLPVGYGHQVLEET